MSFEIVQQSLSTDKIEENVVAVCPDFYTARDIARSLSEKYHAQFYLREVK